MERNRYLDLLRPLAISGLVHGHWLSPAQIQASAGDVLVILGQRAWPGPGGKLLVLAVMLSTIGTLQTTLIQVTRTMFAMARDRTLPACLSWTLRRRQTPWLATTAVAVLALGLFIASNYVGSIGKILSDAISAIGLQIAVYYGLAGLTVVIAFRKVLLKSAGNFLLMGLLPLTGAAFMFWVFAESIPAHRGVVDVLGLGTLALGAIPLVIYWSGGSAYFRRHPGLGRIPPGTPAPAQPRPHQRARTTRPVLWPVARSLRRRLLSRRTGLLAPGEGKRRSRSCLMVTSEGVRAATQTLMPQARRDLAELVALRSVADPAWPGRDDCDKAARLVADLFRAAGLREATLHDTADGSKAVIARAPAPRGAPTIVLYCHYDVQPVADAAEWLTSPFELTESGGRWYGRGAADCKGNIVAHLTALRVLGARAFPVGVIAVAEGSEEQGTGGLESLVAANPGLVRANAILVCDAGNIAAGTPTVTTTLRGVTNVTVHVESMAGPVHSGVFGGPAPDALAALIRILSTLRDERGNTTIRDLDGSQVWKGGAIYPESRFRADAGVLDGVRLLGDGAVADMLWARPAVTVLGIDCPAVTAAPMVAQAKASALVSLRIPPGTDAVQAQDKLTAHLIAAAPWGVRVRVERDTPDAAFVARTDGPAYRVLAQAMKDAYGADTVMAGDGGSIPLCEIFQRACPSAEIAVLGVEDPGAAIHGPNESVDPGEIARIAQVEALFMQRYPIAYQSDAS